MTTTKQYDFLNRLTQISSAPSVSYTLPLTFNYNYNSANQRTKNTLADGSYWVYGYDSLGQVTNACKFFSDGTAVAGQQFDYTFDTIGNRTQTLSGGDQNGQNLRLANYSVNNLNQITGRDVPGTNDVIGASVLTNAITVNGQTAYRKQEYFWQPVKINNGSAAVWTNIIVGGGLNVTGNMYVAKEPEAFLYDADGNLTNDGRWAYTWDAENRLVGMATNTLAGPAYHLTFVYDAQGRRIQKVVVTNGVTIVANTFLYDGWNLLAELNQSHSLVRNYVWGSDLSGTQQAAGGVGGLLDVSYYGSATTNCFPAFDGNGNVAAFINAADGTTAANYEYGPFGEVIRQTGPMARVNPVRFSTKYDDDESDIVNYPHRPYNPSTGRWLSRDPITEPGFILVAGDDSEDELDLVPGVNLYAFVANDPANQIDPFGLAFYAIDGTWTKAKHKANPWQLYMATTENPHRYWRGPYDGPTGLDSYFLARAVKKQICKDYCASGGNMTINLTGWSREACIAAEVAQLLNDEGCDCGCGKQSPIPVNWVGLFDAVSMTPGGWVPNSVPPNVAHFYHAVKTKKMFLFPTHHFAGETAKSIYNYDGSVSSHADVGMSMIRNNKNDAYSWVQGTAVSSGVGF